MDQSSTGKLLHPSMKTYDSEHLLAGNQASMADSDELSQSLEPQPLKLCPFMTGGLSKSYVKLRSCRTGWLLVRKKPSCGIWNIDHIWNCRRLLFFLHFVWSPKHTFFVFIWPIMGHWLHNLNDRSGWCSNMWESRWMQWGLQNGGNLVSFGSRRA